jgi:hypothetical protein
MPLLVALAARYHHPLFERVYFFVALLCVYFSLSLFLLSLRRHRAIVLLPAALYPTLYAAMPTQADGHTSTRHRLIAQGISAAIGAGTFVAFALPITLWSYAVRRPGAARSQDGTADTGLLNREGAPSARSSARGKWRTTASEGPPAPLPPGAASRRPSSPRPW